MLVGVAGSSDVVDAHVVLTAACTSSVVVTSDGGELRRLADQLATPVAIRQI